MIPNPKGSVHQPSPYPNQLLTWADEGCLKFFQFSRLCMDNLFCCFMPITPERKHLWKFYLWGAIKAPFFLLAFSLSVPTLILAIVIYSVIFDFREKHRTSTCDTITQKPQPKKTYGFVTSNLCGHYEYINRINNVVNTRKRVLDVGRIVVSSQMKHMKSEAFFSNGNVHPKSRRKLSDSLDVAIKTEFSETDFFLFQEVMFPEHGAEFARVLHAVFPYVVYDPCDHGFTKNFLLSGGDTMIASKYPILHARFQRYEHKSTCDILASKGLLQAKVHLGDEGGKKLVGYLSNTHMQVYQGNNSMARYHQFDDIVRWTKEYREILRDPNEVIVFDVVAGDFNMSNSSPVDKADWDHPLFDVYEDIGREKPGKDKDFTVGTEMRQSTMYDPTGTTPNALKESLEDPGRRRWHLIDGDIEQINISACFVLPPIDGTTGKVIPSECGGRRRVDYVLTRKEDKVTTRAYNVVTALAGLTDHLPVSLTVDVAH